MVDYTFNFAVGAIATHAELGAVEIVACIKEASVTKYQVRYEVASGYNYAMVLEETLS